MTTVNSLRSAQYSLHAEFILNVGTDGMVTAAGNPTALGAVALFNGVTNSFEPIPLPNNAVLIGGDMTVDVVSNDSGTATVSIGDSNNATRYLAATSIKTAGRTALVPTGYRGIGENIRVTFANQNGNATTGQVSLRVSYIITGRANEVSVV